VRRLLEAVTLPVGHWVEPAVGEGAIVRAVQSQIPGLVWTTVDVRDIPVPSAVAIRDHFPEQSFLTLDPVFVKDAKVVITNPPFLLAREFITESKRLCPNAIRVFLLRLNFLGSEDRREWLAEDMPAQIWQLPNRPSFVRGKTDSIEYGWFVWFPGTSVSETTLRLLPLTSLEERKRG
jgi:hypothetical protein